MTTLNNGGAVKPDIFITGVMKGGTTILHDYICTHPNIQAGSLKEIHYFSLFYDKGPDWYASHFADVPGDCRTIDASPTYFDITNTAQIPRLIRGYTADPRVIIITRDPVIRAISQFIHLKVTTKTAALQEIDIDEFFCSNYEDAYRQNTALGYYLNQVLSFSLYTRKYLTYKQEFEEEQLLVLSNDELRESPKKVMSDVFSFLDMDYVDNELFGVVRYSSGSALNKISLESYNKLAEFLYPDYKHFCQQAGIPFKEAVYDDEQNARSA